MKARNMALCALFAALLSVCAWLSVPVGDIAFTMQTFGIFLTLELLGGKQGTLAILVYLLLGAAGLPVFSGFRSGLGALLGVTGGYILGFLAIGLVYWLLTGLAGEKFRLPAMLLGLSACYLFGSLWFRFGYLQGGNTLGLGMIFVKCVLPYVIPDIIKLVLSRYLAQKLKRFVY